MKRVLYLDVDGVLQYAKDNQWHPRLDAGDFLRWATSQFECRWLTNWVNPNRTVPKQLGIAVPEGITEVHWRKAGPGYPYKAHAISDCEDWLWLEDEPSEFDIADLRRRGRLDRLIIVDRFKPFVLMGQIRARLSETDSVGGGA
jgi:hypothetical protein